MKLFIAIMILELAGRSGLYLCKSEGWKPDPDSSAVSLTIAIVEMAFAAWGLWLLIHN